MANGGCRACERARAALDAVLRRKGLFTGALAAERAPVLGGRYPELRDSFERRRALYQRIAETTLHGPAPRESPEQHRQRLAQWRTEVAQMERELARAVPEIQLEQQREQATTSTLSGVLPRDATLIELVKYQRYDFEAVPARGQTRLRQWRYLAVMLAQGEPDRVRLVDLGEAEPIDRLVYAHLAALLRDPRVIDLDLWSAMTPKGARVTRTSPPRRGHSLGGRTTRRCHIDRG